MVRYLLEQADPLTEAETAELRAMFSKKTGKAIEFDTSVDPTLIAGFKVTVQGKTYDGSLKAQVDKLKNKLVFGS
jgi:F0F1-type ATP synthase delta subunit